MTHGTDGHRAGAPINDAPGTDGWPPEVVTGQALRSMTAPKTIIGLVAAVLLIGGGVVVAGWSGGWSGSWLWGRPGRGEPAATLSVGEVLGGGEMAGYARATAPRPLAFPADHGPHPEYRTEWWYYTGNLATAEGRHFGYQLTFFRTALAPDAPARSSAWATTQVYMAHFAVSDTAGHRFFPHHRFARGAVGLAGASAQPFRVWTDDWIVEGVSETEGASAETVRSAPMRLVASEDDVAIDLTVEPGKPIVLQGDRGWSRKGPEEGNASYYYSLTRMPTRGTIRVGAERFTVHGRSWMDREWSTSSLGDNAGWDWFALQLTNGRDLMFYRLRRSDGTADRFSAGALVGTDGASQALTAEDVRLDVLEHWTSPRGGTRYPARWRLTLPRERLVLDIVPRIADQELREPIRYWEGAVVTRGTDGGQPVEGQGYVELVGYARAPTARNWPRKMTIDSAR
jgi:predicted secreted hydrolase